MKDSLKILTSKEVKAIRQLIEKNWGFSEKLEYAFLQSGKDRVYIVSRDIAKLDFEKLHLNSAGLYIAEVKDEQIRLSIEGAQLIGPKATKNVVELSEDEVKQWIKGSDIKKEGDWEGFVIVKYGNDYLGSGKYKEGMILNFVPKVRRLAVNYED